MAQPLVHIDPVVSTMESSGDAFTYKPTIELTPSMNQRVMNAISALHAIKQLDGLFESEDEITPVQQTLAYEVAQITDKAISDYAQSGVEQLESMVETTAPHTLSIQELNELAKNATVAPQITFDGVKST